MASIYIENIQTRAGNWYDGIEDRDADDFQTFLTAHFGDAELAIVDHEGFHGLSPEGVEQACEWAQLIGEHGEAWALWAPCVGIGQATADEGGTFQDAHLGTYCPTSHMSAREVFAWEWHENYEDGFDIPDYLLNTIDWDHVASELEGLRDLTLIEDSDGCLHVFNARV